MQDFSLHRLSDEDAVRLYEWTERSSSAVLKCTCQQVRRMKTLPELSYAIGALIYPGQTLFLHYETPALFAEVCGMVVGLTVKEDQISYEVDDGTSVLRILETRKSLRQSETRPDQPGSDATVPCGIPECYIMPAQPKASTSTSRLDNSAPTVILPALQPRFEVGDIVRCTGKMKIDLGGQRFIVARRMVRCDNMNMECYHQLDVIKAEMDVYRKPFDWSRVETTRKGPMAKQTTSHRAGRKTPARLILSDLSPNEKAASAPWILADPGQQSYAGRQRLSEETARRLLSGDTLLSSRSTHPASVPCPPREHERTQSSRSSKSIIRPLRAPAKISDQKLTESYFQLQVQQHISLHYHSQSFALSDLQIDKTLSTLAQRLVRIRLQHRLSARPAGSSPDISLISTEQQQDKIHRLFEWAIRKMMQDGFITLADEDHSNQPRASHENDTDSSETYRLVTAEYLLRPLSLLLGNRLLVSPHDIAVQDVDDLLARLRILDDRFRNVDRCLFQDSLALYRVRCTPIVID